MRSTTALLMGLAMILALTACASTNDDPQVQESWEGTYNHSFDFLWEEAQVAMKKYFNVAERDLENRRLVSGWDTQLAYFSEQGNRTRITVEFEEKGEGRWLVLVSEEKQINTEEINPEAEAEADWEAAEADGAAASKFRVNFERRLHPPEYWRDTVEEAAEDAPSSREN